MSPIENFTLKDKDIYENNNEDFPFIKNFNSLMLLVLKKIAQNNAHLKDILSQANYVITPFFEERAFGEVPYVGLDIYIEDENYIEFIDHKMHRIEYLEESIKLVVPRSYKNNLRIDIMPKSLWAPAGGETWRINPQYHFRGEIETVSQNDIEKIWKSSNILHVFISHKSNVSHRAQKVKSLLSEYGISCFVAHEDIEPAMEWQSVIEKALFSSDALIALICKEFSSSKWADQEVGIAIGRQIPVFPIKLDEDADLTGFIGKIQAFRRNKDVIQNLLEQFVLDTRTTSATISSLLQALQQTGDIDKIACALAILEKAPSTVWKTTQKEVFLSLYNEKADVKTMEISRKILDDITPEGVRESLESDFDDNIPF